jgi:hypothetical protein
MEEDSAADIRESYYKFQESFLKLRLGLSLISESASSTQSHKLGDSVVLGLFWFLLPPLDAFKFHLNFSQK